MSRSKLDPRPRPRPTPDRAPRAARAGRGRGRVRGRTRSVAIALTSMVWPASALADEAQAPDLQIKSIPTSVTTLAIERPAAAAAAPVVAAPPIILIGVEDSAADVSTSYRPVPESWRDVQERVMFRLNVGYGFDSGAASGDVGKSGFAPDTITDPNGNEFTETRNYFLGDATVGSRGILLPSLNTYFLSQYRFDLDGASQFASLNNVYDSEGGRALLVHAAYAEIEGADVIGLPGLHIRGGRQFRYGSAMFVTKFDGISAAYDDPGFEVSGFFGRRASVFFGDDPGLVGGAGAQVRLEELAGVPVDLGVDYLFFDGGAEVDLDGDGESEDLARSYVELRGRYTPSEKLRFIARGRLASNGDHLHDGEVENDGMALARLGLNVRAQMTPKIAAIADVDQSFAGEVSYDYINPNPVDVVNVAEQLGIGLDAPVDETRVGARLSAVVSPGLELYGFARANIVSESTSGFFRNWQEGGAAISRRLGGAATLTGQYKLRLTDLDDEANAVGTAFADTSGSGVSSFHEIAGELWYVVPQWKLRAAGGGYFRVYNLQSPYAEVEQDGRAGMRVEADYGLNRHARLKLAAEGAQPSPTFASELSMLVSIRGLMEVLF